MSNYRDPGCGKEPPKFAPGGKVLGSETQANPALGKVSRYLSTLGTINIGTLFKVLLHNYLVLPEGVVCKLLVSPPTHLLRNLRLVANGHETPIASGLLERLRGGQVAKATICTRSIPHLAQKA